MKACYKNDLKKAYLILEGVESEAEDYQIYMLKENRTFEDRYSVCR